MKTRVALFALLACVLAFLASAFYTRTNGPALRNVKALGLLVRSRTIEQPLVAREDGLFGVSYMLSTYGRANTRTLDVSVLDGADGCLISKKTYRAEDIRDNTIYKQTFPRQAHSRGHAYRIVFESDDSKPKNALTVQGVPVSEFLPEAIYGEAPVSGYSAYCECAYDVVDFRTAWTVVAGVVLTLLLGLLVDRGLSCWERRRVRAETGRKERQGNIELLRLILMFLIILHHAAYSGVWARSIWQPGLMLAYTVFTYWHVVAFVAISGWFGINFTWMKLLRFWGIVFFYSALPLALDWIVYDRPVDLTQLLGPNKRLWFVGPYMVLMLISPILNSAVETLKAKGLLVKAWCMFALVILAGWGPYNLCTFMDVKGAGPSSPLTLLFIYFSARVVKVTELYRRFNRGRLMLLFFVCLCGIAGWGIAENIGSGCFNPVKWFSRYVMYDNLLLIAAGICVVVFFAEHVRLPSRWNPVVRFLGKSAFALYLLQSVYTFYSIRRDSQTWFHQNWGLSPMMSVFIVSAATFVGFLCLDIVRRCVLAVLAGGLRMGHAACLRVLHKKEF